MASSHRKTYKTLFSNLQQRYPKFPATPERSCEILEMLIYAMFLENSSILASNRCLKTLEEYFIDWNEIRVSTAGELGDVFPDLYEPNTVGERIRRTLQWLFENIYKFDLEEYRTQGQAELTAFLETIPFTTHFISALTGSLVFKMQDIPVDEGMKRVLRLLDLIEIDDENHEAATGLSSAFTQTDRLPFFCLLHELGAELMADPESADVRSFLEEIDAEVTSRSWIPLVESDEVTDPVVIAREVMKNERKKNFPFVPFVDELDLLNDDDTAIEKLGVDDETPYDEESENYDDSELMPDSDSDVGPIADDFLEGAGDDFPVEPPLKKVAKVSKPVAPEPKPVVEKALEKVSKELPKESAKSSKQAKSAKISKPAKSGKEESTGVKKAPPKSEKPVAKQGKAEPPKEKTRAEDRQAPKKPETKAVKKVVEGRRRTPAAAEPPNPAPPAQPPTQGVKKTGPKGVAVRSKETAKNASGSKKTSADASKVSPVKKLQQKKPR